MAFSRTDFKLHDFVYYAGFAFLVPGTTIPASALSKAKFKALG